MLWMMRSYAKLSESPILMNGTYSLCPFNIPQPLCLIILFMPVSVFDMFQSVDLPVLHNSEYWHQGDSSILDL